MEDIPVIEVLSSLTGQYVKAEPGLRDYFS
jgi:hypothetical protein